MEPSAWMCSRINGLPARMSLQFSPPFRCQELPLLVDSPFVVWLCDEWFGSFWPMFPMGVNNNDSKMLDWGKLNYELCLLRCITKCYAQSLYMYQVWIWLLTPFSLPECGFLWQSLLTDPNPASPANPESAQLYQSDIQAYNRWAMCIQFYCSSLVIPVQRKKIARADLERELLIWVIDTHKVMNTLILGSCLFWFAQNCLPLKCYCVISSAVSYMWLKSGSLFFVQESAPLRTQVFGMCIMTTCELHARVSYLALCTRNKHTVRFSCDPNWDASSVYR